MLSEQNGYYNDLNLNLNNTIGNNIYENIISLSQNNLSKDMRVSLVYDIDEDSGDEIWQGYFTNQNYLSSKIVGDSKFWILSFDEVCSLLGGQYNNYWCEYDEFGEETEFGSDIRFLNQNGDEYFYWWTRSSFTNSQNEVMCVRGDGDEPYSGIDIEFAIRPAFLFNL